VPVSLKTWALAELLAWAFLDQRPARRVNKQAIKATKNRVRRRREAHQAGAIALAFLLEEQLDNFLNDNGAYDEAELKAIWSQFQFCGGISKSVGGWGYEGLLSELDLRIGDRLGSAKTVLEEGKYVFQIVQFVCRYQAFSGINGTIDLACDFVELNRQSAGYGDSKIEKIWHKYKDAAPYIYGFLPVIRDFKHVKGDAERVIDWLKSFVSNPQKLHRYLGRAAFAVDALAKTRARNVRVDDFRDVARVTPRLRSFTEDELCLIDSARASKTAPLRN
jgi:hypothetical protein